MDGGKVVFVRSFIVMSWGGIRFWYRLKWVDLGG